MSTHPTIIAATGHLAQAEYLEQRVTSSGTVGEPAARQILWAMIHAHRAAAEAVLEIAKKDEMP